MINVVLDFPRRLSEFTRTIMELGIKSLGGTMFDAEALFVRQNGGHTNNVPSYVEGSPFWARSDVAIKVRP